MTDVQTLPAFDRRAWLPRLIFGLDDWLRQRQGVYEYSRHPQCLFRIQSSAAETALSLSDGTEIQPGDSILDLHIWNEQMPKMEQEVTVAWARRLSRAIALSLRELALYLARHPELDRVVAMRADMRLGNAERSGRLFQLSSRYGFERVDGAATQHPGPLQALGENLFLLLLLLATNPASLRHPSFWRDHTIVYLSRKCLVTRYGVPAGPNELQ